MLKHPPFQALKLLLLLSCFLVIHTSWAQDNVYNMQSQTVNDCMGTLYDSGGPDDRYADGEDYIFSICPSEEPACIRLDVISFAIENTFDILSFYDGPDTNSTLLGRYPTLLPAVIDAHSGCLTIHFSSDLGTRFDGWEMQWNCYAAPGCPALPVSPQDCIGAIPICQNVYMEEEAYIDEGNVDAEINQDQSCLGDGEKNSVWYTFTVQESGELSFLITPNNDNDDYDWAVYNLTNFSCADIYELSSIEVSCSFSQQTGATGPTGESDQTQAGADDGNKNATIMVEAGDIYVINVSQFSISTAGYSIDFSASTAVIFDQVAPAIKSADLVYEDCQVIGVDVLFTENVLCSSVNSFGFNLRAGTNLFLFSEAASETCLQEGDMAYAKAYRLLLQNPIGISNEYTLNLSGAVEDLCGNMSEAGSNFVINEEQTSLRTVLIEEDCQADLNVNYTIGLEGVATAGNYNWKVSIAGEEIDSVFLGSDIATLQLEGTAKAGILTWEILDVQTNCLFSGNIELGAECSVCPENTTGGSVELSENLVCAEETLILSNPTAIVVPDFVLTYYLEAEDGTQIRSNEGEFSLATQNVIPNQIYQVNSVVNFDTDNDGFADMEGECALFSSTNPTVIFLAPIAIDIVSERCVDRNYHMEFTVTGGLPAFDTGTTYNVTGDFVGEVAWGDTIRVTYNGDAAYQLQVTADLQQCLGVEAIRSFPFVCTPAPIELLDFWGEADQNGILLSWNTVSELNNAYFVLEREVDKQAFSTIGTVEGSGTSTRLVNYNFLDKSPLPGYNHYRLLQVDVDGQSEVVAETIVNWGEERLLSINYWTWPSINQPIVTDLFIEGQPASISLLNIEGKVITQRIINQSGRYLIMAPVYAKGVYFLKLSDGLRTVVTKVTVQ